MDATFCMACRELPERPKRTCSKCHGRGWFVADTSANLVAVDELIGAPRTTSMSDDACVFCGVECVTSDVEHLPSCPSVTGLYPVRLEDLGPTCTHCGQPSIGMICPVCREPFQVGDMYVLVGGDPKPEDQADGIENAYYAGTITCIGCAAQDVETHGEAA
jgi:hypothetical protein